MESWLPLVIQAISGFAGGNTTGAAMKKKSLGKVGNSITGMVGGVLGGLLLNYLGDSNIDVSSLIGNLTNSGADASSTIENVAGGGIGGSILMIIVSLIKNKLKK